MKSSLKNASPNAIYVSHLAGEPITSKLDKAPGNREAFGGIKVNAENGWFAARPSGTEDVYKIYAESFISRSHLDQVLSDAKKIVVGLVGGVTSSTA